MGSLGRANPEGPFAISPRFNRELMNWCFKFAGSCTEAHVQRCAPILRDLNLASRHCYEVLSNTPGIDFGLQQRGLLMMCKTDHAFEDEKRLAVRARTIGLNADALTREETMRLDPGLELDIAGSVYFPQDCHLHPNRLAAALTHELTAGGTEFRWNAQVMGGTIRDERVESVVTADGRIETDEIVIAAGAWSGPLAKQFGVRIPMQAGKGYSMTLRNPTRMPSICSILTEARVAVTPMAGSLRFAGTMEITGLDLSINSRRAGGIVKSVPSYFPEFSSEDFAGTPIWSGLRPCSPDGMPYIGRTGRLTLFYPASQVL